MSPRLLERSAVAWFPRSVVSASGFWFFSSAALGVWRRWENLQRSLIHIIVVSGRTGELYRGPCLVK